MIKLVLLAPAAFMLLVLIPLMVSLAASVQMATP